MGLPGDGFRWPAEYEDKPLLAYESTPEQCYVLLRPLGNSVFSTKASVCMAVLENLNRFCGEPPQFERRRIHASSRISGPAWIQIDPLQNFEIVKQTISGEFPPQYREERWRLQEARLRTLAQEGVLQLAKADLQGVAENPTLGPSAPIGATERCTLQSKNDRAERAGTMTLQVRALSPFARWMSRARIWGALPFKLAVSADNSGASGPSAIRWQ